MPNVNVKLSGPGTFVHRVDPALIGRICDETIDAFATQRCVFGSNFPIEKLWTGYAALVDAYRDAVAGHDPSAQRAIFHDNAVRLYRLGER
jgi:predicted TIM-barrel fold metal-dependent hydrolase